jgi:hypothetical protein
MSSFKVSGPAEEDIERIIDRSGDLDQRPAEERVAPPANIVPFRPAFPPEAEPIVPLTRLQVPPAAWAPTRRAPSAPLDAVARLAQAAIDSQFAKAKAHLHGLAQKIEAKEKKCALPKLDADLQHIRAQRHKMLIANGPALANHLREERSRLADLERFKAENGLTRDAHYPASPLLGFGILAILILLEAAINGVLFADTSDRGLFGGWLEAMALAITNVGVAFLVGSIVLPQVNRRSLPAKAGAIAFSLAGLAALVAVNLFGAHYRDFRAAAAQVELAQVAQAMPRRDTVIAVPGQKSASSEATVAKLRPATLPFPEVAAKPASSAGDKAKRSEIDALGKVFEAPLHLESFTSVFLLIIGLCAATVAAADGYKFDDPFPGYGKRHRRYAEARAANAAALRRILSHSNAAIAAAFHTVDRKLEACAHDLAELAQLHRAYAGDLAAFKDAIDDAARDGEDDIARHDRLLNKLPDRSVLDLYALSAPSLPALNEKHAKFVEIQEKKLKALQKAVQREKDESLGVFESASEGFAKLIAEVVQASLQIAPASPGAASASPGLAS